MASKLRYSRPLEQGPARCVSHSDDESRFCVSYLSIKSLKAVQMFGEDIVTGREWRKPIAFSHTSSVPTKTINVVVLGTDIKDIGEPVGLRAHVVRGMFLVDSADAARESCLVEHSAEFHAGGADERSP